MDADEREVYHYLKSWRNQFISAREICRRAGGKKRFYDEPDWAKPVLLRMVEKNILETDAAGSYRLKPVHGKNKRQKWVAPQIARILKESGKDFDESIKVDDQDFEYYDKL
jgi:hypothetical protein